MSFSPACSRESSLRVLFLSDHLGYPDGVTTGATTYFLNVLPPLKAAGVDLHVCFLRDRHPTADQLENRDIFPVFLNRGKWDPRALTDLLGLVKTQDIDIVHAAGMKGILLGRAAGRMTQRKVVMHLHDTSVPGPLFGALHRNMASWTHRCLAISNAVAEIAHGRFGLRKDRITVLYNGIDLDKAASPSAGARERIRRELGLADDAQVLGLIGRLSPEKGQAFFLPAFPELLATHPRARLLVVGEGPTRKACEQAIAQRNTATSVILAGHRPDIPDILAAIDVLLVPSLMEGLSFCAIEAMAAGRPVAAFNVGGLPELITHDQTGVLAPARDASALVQQVRRLLDDQELSAAIVSNAREFAQRFSVEQHVRKLIGIYEQVLHSPAPVR